MTAGGCPYPGCFDPPGPDHWHDLGVIFNARYYCPDQRPLPQPGSPFVTEPQRHRFGPKGRCELCGYRIKVPLRQRISRMLWRAWFSVGGG